MYADYEQAKAHARDTYWQRRNEGMCVKCGKRFSEAGHVMCLQCGKASRAADVRNDPGGKKHLAWINNRNNERKAKGLCIDCGRKLTDRRFVRCKACRKRRAEYTQVNRIRERIHRMT